MHYKSLKPYPILVLEKKKLFNHVSTYLKCHRNKVFQLVIYRVYHPL